MRRQSTGVFLLINAVVSLSVALLVIMFYNATQEEEAPRARPTIVLVFTATPDPNQPLSADQLQLTVDALELTSTAYVSQLNSMAAASAGGGAGVVSTQIPGSTAAPSTGDNDLPTLPPEIIPSLPSSLGGGGGSAASPTPTSEDGCQRYFVRSGDTVSSIAQQFGVTMPAIFQLNGLNDRSILQVGDEILIPSPECEPDATPTPTPSPRPTFNLTIVAPTVTLAPTAQNAQVQLMQVLNFGDVTTEQVDLQNIGGEVNLRGWTLTDSQGNVYTFPEVRLVPGSIIRVLTRTGSNTPGFLYWNLNTPVWERGEVASLRNAEGELQSVLTVGGEAIQFGTPGN